MDVDRPPDMLFTCVDPRGRHIEARKQRWDEHVRTRHPEVSSHADVVRATLEAPDLIVADFDNPDGLNYYRFGVLPAPYHRLYLKVVVTFLEIETLVVGEVITAYPTGRIARGEVQQWP